MRASRLVGIANGSLSPVQIDVATAAYGSHPDPAVIHLQSEHAAVIHGRHLFCAAVDHDLGEPEGRLHSDGDLIAAVASGDPARLRSVIAAGAPVNAPSRFNRGAPALHLCIYLHPELVGPLVDAGADVNAATREGSTPLMAAAAAGANRKLIERLVEWGARLDAVDARGFTAAHVAAQFGYVDALAALVDCGANLQSTTPDGLTPSAHCSGNRKEQHRRMAHHPWGRPSHSVASR